MDDLILYGIPVAAIIVGLVEMLKGSVKLPERWAAPVAVALGLLFALLGWFDMGAEASLLEAVLLGIMTGLTAAGLYSGGRAVAGVSQSEVLRKRIAELQEQVAELTRFTAGQ